MSLKCGETLEMDSETEEGTQDFSVGWAACALTEEAADIYKEMLSKEEFKHCIVKLSEKSIGFRMILTEWMTSAGQNDLHSERLTIHMSIRYLDLILGTIYVARSKLQLVALACMLLAGVKLLCRFVVLNLISCLVSVKFNEQECKVPDVEYLNALSDYSYTYVFL